MDILDISASMKQLAHNGNCLNLEEKLQLEIGLQQLLNNSAEVEFEELLFWGKIQGLNKDYFIAIGINYTNKYEFPEKTFFWASSQDFTFKKFPQLNDQHKNEYNHIKDIIVGDPNKVHKKVEPEKVEGEEENQEQQQPKEVDPLASSEEEDPASLIVPVNLKEIDRIHYLVRAIENDCSVAPNGAFKLTTDHEVHRNEAFRGLKKEEAFKLENYSHFRNVQQKEKKEGIEKDDAIFKLDFLDTITQDRPNGCWGVQKDSSGTIAILRNLLWPGFCAFHKVGTRQFGYFYIGDGQKNTELPFML